MFSFPIKYWLAVIVALTAFAACTKDVNISPQAYEGKLSIQGLITPGKAPTAYIYRTIPFFDPNVLPRDLFVRNAVVTLSSDEGTEVLRPDSILNPALCYYEYFYVGKIPVKVDKTYKLAITYQGVNLSATAITDRRIVQLDSVTYVPQFKDLYGEHEGIVLHFKDPVGIGEYYRFAMGRTFGPKDTILGVGKVASQCALGKTTWIQEIGRTIYTDQNGDGTAFTITIEPTNKHKQGQIGYVRLQSLDQASYVFYDQYDRQKLAQFNPFVEPVFIKPGQFGTRAIGVFGAYAVSDSIRFVYPE